MALITRCQNCRRRLKKEEIGRGVTACPACGSAAFRYAIDYWPNGRHGGRKQKTLPEGTTPTEAAAWENAIRAVKRKAIPGASPVSTVADLFPDYLKWYKTHRAETSLIDCTHAWNNWISTILGRFPVRDISAEHFSLYQQSRTQTKTNRAPNKELDYFKGFLRWCRREKKIDVPRVEYDRLPYKRPLPVVLIPKEVELFLEAAKSEPLWHALFLCLYYLGLRVNGARNLKPSDFDFTNRAVRVRQKGGSYKILPLNAKVTTAIRRLIKIRSCGPDDHLFVSRNGQGKPVYNIRQAVDRIRERAGIKKRVYPHLFRHSIATEMMGRNINIRTIQDFLGHKNMRNTEFYTHVSLENLRAAQSVVSTNRRTKST